MEIIIGKYSGFCAGVKYTITEAMKILNEYKKVYCLGEIVHNEEVVNKLTDNGMITVDDIDDVPTGAIVIFRAHGEAPEIYEKAEKRNIKVFDLTCGKIKIIHNKINKINDSFVIIIAKKNHPETIGTYGYIKNGYVIEDYTDIDECYSEFIKSHKKDIYIISQTTFSSNKFDLLVDTIKNKFSNVDITIDKTICMATESRQKEVIELSKQVDIMLIVGGKNSSNTKELYNLALENCKCVYLIQTVNDIDFEIGSDKKVGIMAGASTDYETVNGIVDKLKVIYTKS